jgi:KDO2-lipid IV(A) lauroyltransferase
LLPFRLLYLFSDLLCLVLYYFARYRKKVVSGNLGNAFPGKTDKEIGLIRRAFYRNLCDLFLESVKLMTISKKTMLRRCRFAPGAFEVFSGLVARRQSAIIAMGHMGNWEWACNSFSILCEQQLFVVYHPLGNLYFDNLMRRLRSRNRAKLIAMKDTYREMVANKGGLNATAFVADQSPQPYNAHWARFLNQDTPVFRGVEVIAKKMNLPIIYTSVKKVKRGYYEMHAEMLEESPMRTSDGELSEMFMARLERDIISKPAEWLWSHRRWKHKRTSMSSL